MEAPATNKYPSILLEEMLIGGLDLDFRGAIKGP